MSTINSSLTKSLFKEDVDYLTNIIKNEFPLPWDTIDASVKVPNSQQDGYSSIYVNKRCQTHNDNKPFSTIHPSIKTLPDLISLFAALYADHDCLGERVYNKKTKKFDDFFTFETYLTSMKRQKLVGAGIFKLLEENVFRKDHHNFDKFVLTLYSRNRKEWVLTDVACQFYNICDTSLYDTLGPETSSYILNLTESPIVVCSKEKLDVLLEIKKKDEIPFLISVVSMDDLDEEDEHYYSLFYDLGVQLVDFKYLEQLGEANPIPFRPPQPEDLYTLSFTSGTTGPPKGVEIPHSMAVAALTFAGASLPRTSKPTQAYSLSFLPLAHIYERMNFLNCLCSGAGLGFPHDGLPTSLVENLKILKPTVLSCVPRVFSKFEVAIKDKLHQPGLFLSLASNAIKAKILKQSSRDGEKGHLVLRDRLIIRKFEEALGVENIEYMVSGSAPMSDETAKFLKLALNTGFSQGYGLTESFAGCCFSSPFELDPGSCGPVCLTCELKLKDIPEMNYHSRSFDEPPKGELLLRGPQIFPRYYKNPKLTEELIDSDGWFHTGDVATIDPKGRLHIIDRVKNFFKLSQGEYITPERIENVYLSQSPALTQLYVHGDSFNNYLVAIAGVDIDHLRKMVKHHRLGLNLISANDEELVKAFNADPKLRKALIDSLNRAVKDEGLQGFEKIHNVYVAIEPLKVEDEVITPTMKIKRVKAKNHFKDILDGLYKEGSLIKNSKL